MMLAFARPTMVGALLPSSRALASAMAQAADGAELIVELGAGTGAITAGLVERHPNVPTIAVELQDEMAQMLTERFPQVDVRAASAHRVLHELRPGDAQVAVVSSLPFRSLPPRWSEPTRLAIEQFLLAGAHRRLVQYTYQPRVPFDLRRGARLRWQRQRVVWRNAPPAWVWTLAVAGQFAGTTV
jgi:phosphatidylethanolamine/phosphatidyl-N-methylethanolamine N-methyltransferase